MLKSLSDINTNDLTVSTKKNNYASIKYSMNKDDNLVAIFKSECTKIYASKHDSSSDIYVELDERSLDNCHLIDSYARSWLAEKVDLENLPYYSFFKEGRNTIRLKVNKYKDTDFFSSDNKLLDEQPDIESKIIDIVVHIGIWYSAKGAGINAIAKQIKLTSTKSTLIKKMCLLDGLR